jgi:putative DNA-invertase from lambdoid prophage Rac
LRDRVKAGIAEARKNGKPHGRPATVTALADEANKLFLSGISKSRIAKLLGIGRTSVRRLLNIKRDNPV